MNGKEDILRGRAGGGGVAELLGLNEEDLSDPTVYI
jgi:hypothetical protein